MIVSRRALAFVSVTAACAMVLAAFTPVRALFSKGEAAAAAAFSKWDGQGQLITFAAEDFTAGVTGDEELSAIVLSSLPAGGLLRLAGQEVRVGEAISADRLSALCFVPEIGVDVHTAFDFRPVFSRSGAGEQAVTVHLNISDTQNAAPIAVEQRYETYADLPLYGRLKAVDPEGDPCTFTVVDQGKRGVAEITPSGFRYLPSGKSGSDAFSVVATDCYGNRSQPTQITVSVVKRHEKEVFTYTDMTEHPAHYAALQLRQAGVFSGESFGTEAFFCPEATVSRAEFLAMAAAVADLAMPTAAVSTGLSDNDATPVWAQSYVAAGIVAGVVQGSDDGQGNRAFLAENAITRAEAAAIADRSLALADDGRGLTFADSDTVPVWAAQSVVNCSALGMLPVREDNTICADEMLTRADAAVMLYEMLKFRAE